MTELMLHAIEIAERYYDDKTLHHALSVATHATNSSIIKYNEHISKDVVFILGLLHDIMEDTDYNIDEDEFMLSYKNSAYGGIIFYGLKILTKDKSMDYNTYIKHIKDEMTVCIEAYIVKQADLWDHLKRTETLTDRLKEKYLSALVYFL